MNAPWKVGEHGVPRTGQTTLTDDQLIICDALFSKVTAEGLFLHGDFGATFNLPFARRIPHDEMPQILASLRSMGAIEATDSRGVPFVGITSSGGALWEQERRPLWDSYCKVRQPRRDEDQILQIWSIRRDIAEALFEGGADAGLWQLADRELEVTVEHDTELVSWRRATTTCVKARIAKRAGIVNWTLYETRRRWWRSVSELLRTHGLLLA